MKKNNGFTINIIELRQAVGFLGEKNGWWNTNFFDPSSKDFLSYIFPKSMNNNLVFHIEAIRYALDAEVGANYFHLFRLPVEVEEELYKSGYNMTTITNEEDALNILEINAAGLNIEHNVGPIYVGTVSPLNQDVLQVISAHYYSAFNENYIVHPYLN